MAGGRHGGALRQIEILFGAGTSTGTAEGHLLERFLARRDQAAFGALVARHGPMVLGVCRRILADPHDVEDAFQATFLILVRKARAIRDRELLGPWLYGVARRVSNRVRADSSRRRTRERSGAEEAAMETPGGREPDELRAVLDEELGRLPEKYRAPIVLCYLEGLTHDEAALRLSCPVGTVRSRMSRARATLRARLSRRGLAMPTAVLGPALAAEATAAVVPPKLLEETIQAAMDFAAGHAVTGAVSAGAAALSERVLRTMLMTKLGAIAAIALLTGITAGGAGMMTRGLGQSVAQAPRSTPGDANPPRTKNDETGNEADELRRRQAELIDEVRSLKEELKTAKAARGTPGPAGMSGMSGMPVRSGMGGPGFPMGDGIFGGVEGSPKPSIPTLESPEMIVVESPGRDRIWAQSIETGVWKMYRVPKGVKAWPIVSRTLLAVAMEGPEVTQIAAFDTVSGEWTPQDLREPAHGLVPTQVNSWLAVYVVGRHVYAFSAPAKRWGVLEVAEGTKPYPTLSPTYIKVEDGSHLHLFSSKTGRWSSLDTKGDH